MSRRITLGSRADNDFSYQSPSVSGYHAVLKIENSVVIIEDLNSTNGTYINGKPVKESILKSDDKLELGVFEVPVDELFKTINSLELQDKKEFSQEYNIMLSNFKIYRKKKNSHQYSSKMAHNSSNCINYFINYCMVDDRYYSKTISIYSYFINRIDSGIAILIHGICHIAQ